MLSPTEVKQVQAAVPVLEVKQVQAAVPVLEVKQVKAATLVPVAQPEKVGKVAVPRQHHVKRMRIAKKGPSVGSTSTVAAEHVSKVHARVVRRAQPMKTVAVPHTVY